MGRRARLRSLRASTTLHVFCRGKERYAARPGVQRSLGSVVGLFRVPMRNTHILGLYGAFGYDLAFQCRSGSI